MCYSYSSTTTRGSSLAQGFFNTEWYTHEPSPSSLLLQFPQCYLHAPPRLQPGYFQKFQPDTLFYIFYGMPGDEAQLYAAEELGAR